MAGLDIDLIRHALTVAQEHGFAEIELGLDGASFKARLEAGAKKKAAPAKSAEPALLNGEAGVKYIRSPIVGFYRIGPKALEQGKSVSTGDVVAVVNALGIANEVESKVAGEVVEVLVKDGQGVEFGQILAKVKA